MVYDCSVILSDVGSASHCLFASTSGLRSVSTGILPQESLISKAERLEAQDAEPTAKTKAKSKKVNNIVCVGHNEDAVQR
eukprot:1912184-Amphidinium_carterae.3